ncbi:9539_t:CDS:2 [Ambispora leptoticha]|uniref:9539_t:CDS:1 n=1 Tax=Ambispora leptoticha TaxID=144679 RepID=A0A9N9BAZ8_9GLOM|nr:9539_t:CDS:2 [Ambispora leptoticha]
MSKSRGNIINPNELVEKYGADALRLYEIFLGPPEQTTSFDINGEISNSPEIQLVSPSVTRVIQEGGEISEDLKKAKYIFFPINNSENHETGDAGSHWTLLVFAGGELGVFLNYNSLEFSVTPENAMKVATNFHEKANLLTLLHVENVKETPRQANNADCGVYIIAFTRALVKKIREKGEAIEGLADTELREKDLIFSITEERQKLKTAGFPKKGTPGKDYEIGDDVEYLEKEEELISQ